MEQKEYLYRYTSLENLALTLKNHTIRLNPLDKMDDLQEKRTRDVENIGKFVFISSWTEEEKEDIPMWKMYTDMRTGVRIKLPKNPFRRTPTFLNNPKSGEDHIVLDTLLSYEQLLERGVISSLECGDILFPVKYTEDPLLLEPKIRMGSGDFQALDITNLGKYKNTYWEFQKEWRYILFFTPYHSEQGHRKAYDELIQTHHRMLEGTEPPPFRHFDLVIDQNAFEKMEITLSPQFSSGNRILLETIVEKYNPSASIKESELKNLI